MNLPSLQDLFGDLGGLDPKWIIAGVAVAIGLVGFLFLVVKFRRARDRFQKELADLRISHSNTDTRQSNLNKELKKELNQELGEELKKLGLRMDGLDETDRLLVTDIKGLDQRLKALEPESSDPAEVQITALVDTANTEAESPTPEAIKPPGQILIKDMVEWAKEAGFLLTAVKATLGLFGNLSPSDDGDNWLAEDGQKNAASFVFPRSERFETAGHYDIYRSFYDCVQPSAGRIVVESPAIVETDSEQGGWRLSSRGQLSVIS